VKRYFWLRRNILTADVLVPGFGPLAVANTHTAAFANDGTKKEQLEIFKEKLDEIDADGRTLVAGGDLNTLPPGSEKTEDFPDQVCEGNDFEAGEEKAEEVEWMKPLMNNYRAAIPTDTFAENNEPYFTFTSDKDGFWNRKLDYLFTNAQFEDALVHQSVQRGGLATMPLSDHAPITVELVLP
jgi:endonuclease/exonuclease/phosphatase family metal-dependent hydrolase